MFYIINLIRSIRIRAVISKNLGLLKNNVFLSLQNKTINVMCTMLRQRVEHICIHIFVAPVFIISLFLNISGVLFKYEEDHI